MTPLSPMFAAFDPWILAFSLVTVAVTIWMGFRSAKTSKSASDFFVAGRSVSVGWNASAISGEYLSAASFMGVAGMVMSSGYDALWYPVCYACGYLFLLLFIAGPLRRFGAYTIPDFAEGRYDSPLFRKIAVIFVLFIGFFYTMPQMKGAGTTLAYIFPGLPYWVGVVLVGAVITLNVALGGMKGITLVQAFQYWAKMFAISVPVFVLMSVYGHYGKQLEVNSATGSAQATANLTNSTPTIPKGEMPVILEPARGSGQPEYLYLSKSSFRVVAARTVDRSQFGDVSSADKRLADRVFDLKRRVGLANAESRSLTIPNLDLTDALAQLSYRVEKTVFFHTNLNSILKTNLGTINIPDPTSQRVISALVTVLGRHGVSVIEDQAGALFAIPSDLARSPLIELATAPVAVAQPPVLPSKDGTGLNPFGPLTTKAASDFEVIAADSSLAAQIQPVGQTLYANNLIELLERLKQGFQKPAPAYWRNMVTAGTTNIVAHMPGPLLVYSAAVGKPVAWQTNLAALPAFPLDVTHTPETSDAQFAAKLAAGFAANGVSLVESKDGVVIAVASGDLQRQRNTASGRLGVANSSATVSRGTLPAKAPTDETWLNPFGPLTTKAAKAAAAAAENASTVLSSNSFVRLQPSASVLDTLQMFSRAAARGAQPSLSQKARKAKDDLLNMLPGSTNSRVSVGSASGEISLASAMDGWFEQPTHRFTNVFLSKKLLDQKIKNYDLAAGNTAGLFERFISHVEQSGVAMIKNNGTEVWIVPQSERPATELALANFRRPVDPKPYALLYTYSLIIALVCGTAGLPHILVRFYTNPDGVAAKRTTMWVMILIGVFYVFPPVFGVMGRNLMPSLYEGTGAKGTDKVVLELPKVLDSRSPAAASAGQVSRGESGQGGTAAVSPAPPPTFSPAATPATGTSGGIPWGSILSGITCAGAFAAFMSTFSGLLVSMTGALAHDVYGRMLRPNSTPADRLRMFKWCAVLTGGVAVVLGCFVEPLQINFMVGQAFAIAAASYFPLLFMSVWWRGMTIRGAATGMLAGGVCALAAVTLTNFSDLKWLPLADFWAAHPLLRILCEQPAIWTVPLAIGLMVVVSKLTRASVPADIRMKMLVLHAPEKLGLKQEYIKEHEAQPGH